MARTESAPDRLQAASLRVGARRGQAAGALSLSVSTVCTELSVVDAGTTSAYRCLLAAPVLVLLAWPEYRRTVRSRRRVAGVAGPAAVEAVGGSPAYASVAASSSSPAKSGRPSVTALRHRTAQLSRGRRGPAVRQRRVGDRRGRRRRVALGVALRSDHPSKARAPGSPVPRGPRWSGVPRRGRG